jgi:hypothetical protein
MKRIIPKLYPEYQIFNLAQYFSNHELVSMLVNVLPMIHNKHSLRIDVTKYPTIYILAQHGQLD